jgi:biopolymer transport protein ExbD
MGFERFRTLLALPLGSLFLILLVSVFAIQRPASVGVRMPLLRLKPPRPELICDGRWVFVHLLDDGTTKINEKQIRQEELALLVQSIMESRAERVIYVVPSPGIPYSRFLETVSTLRQAVPDMHIGVLSGKLRNAYMRPSLERQPCDIEWPVSDF